MPNEIEMLRQRPRRHLARAAVLVLALSAALVAGCDRANSQSPHGMPPPEVSVVTVAPRAIPASFEYVGQTAGSREVEVRARVTGILLKRNYQEGGVVAAGQSLFTIDPAPYEAAQARAAADVAAASARLAQAERNVERFRPLYAARAISQKTYDDAVSEQAVAAADLKAARARLTEARLALGYTRVESPISGIASRALRSEGNYVSGADVLLTTVTQTDPIHVLFGISDDERLKLLREAEAGRIVLPPDGAFSVSVKLAEGSVSANAGRLTFSDVRISGTTGTSEARAELPNPDGLLRPGQFVRVILNGAERPAAILVPQRAVLEGPKGKFVYVVNAAGKAEARPVEVGDWAGSEWIITAGLTTGENVIVDGVMRIGPGAPVRVAAPRPAGPDSSAPPVAAAAAQTAAAH